MGRVFNTVATITASAVSRSNRKKTLRNINKINQSNRNLTDVGRVSTDQIIPTHYQIGNVCISGGSFEVRNSLLVQSVLQSCSVGIPSIVIHEGNHHLEHNLSKVCSSQYFFRIINASNPYYDPVFRLNDDDVARIIVESSLKDHKIGTEGILYIRALSNLLRKKGITPYLRMLATCPHGSIQSIILKEEQMGSITSDEATSLRNDFASAATARASIEYYFSQIQAESDIIAWKSNLSRCTSISECVNSGGVISIDVGNTNKKTQLSLIATEIENCIIHGNPCRVILDVSVLSGNEQLISMLKTASNSLCWTISTPDIGNVSGTTKEDLSTWLALSHRVVIFSHGVHTSELLSAELGDYEQIEVTQSHAGNNSIGQFGLHFGANNNISTTNKRERVIRPEEITSLGDKEFIMLDNNNASLYKGSIS